MSKGPFDWKLKPLLGSSSCVEEIPRSINIPSTSLSSKRLLRLEKESLTNLNLLSSVKSVDRLTIAFLSLSIDIKVPDSLIFFKISKE